VNAKLVCSKGGVIASKAKHLDAADPTKRLPRRLPAPRNGNANAPHFVMTLPQRNRR
jgi:hypothetical protein